MRTLSAAELLSLWELGQGRTAPERALAALAAHAPQTGRDALASLPVGARDRRLLEMIADSWGPDLQGHARCPACDTELEVSVPLERLYASAPEPPAGPFTLDLEELHLVFRLPNGQDMVEAARCPSAAAARRLLLERCLIEARRDGSPAAAADLTGEEAAALATAMESLDPGGDLRLALACESCGHAWEMALDPAAFLWERMESEGKLLLYEVCALAKAFGWEEERILALSPWRRQAYLRVAGL